jgi:hypothetical protein
MAASLSAAAKSALLPWARGGHGGLARVLLGGAFPTVRARFS